MLELVVTTVNGLVLVGTGIAARQLGRAYKKFSSTKAIQGVKAKILEDKLPSVTVCIPARNEDHALSDSLQSVLSSDYPKLEIIVLDDNSVDNTSVLIKSFAHAGVRFVSGSKLPAGWLGKNYALQGLLNESSGSYVLFMDVDTRLSPGSISSLVAYTLGEEASMVSVMPRRDDSPRASVIFAPLRYFWEIMFHRKDSPAAAGNAWLIDRKQLESYGEIDSLRDKINPESQLAAHFTKQNSYRFLVSDGSLGVSYEKKWTSQLGTSNRLLYPLLGRRWIAALVAVVDLLIFIAPLVIFIAFGRSLSLEYWVATLASIVAVSVLYGLYAKLAWRSWWELGFFIWPFIILQEAALIASSFIMYSRNRVTWKGRPVRSEEKS